MIGSGLESFTAPGSDLAGLPGGTRVGMLVHQASVDRSLRHAVELVARRTPLRVARLFAPEHGMFGESQDMETVGDAVDPGTGARVVSLYGADAGSLRPSPAELEDLDAMVIDLQDVGSRYYTFVYTMAHTMEACGEAGLPVVVLDRPNPIGGARVQGPVLDPSMASFIGRYPVPVRHGMTVGELARMFRDAFDVRCDLRVVPMAGWRRPMDARATGLPWVAPSPNMPTPETAGVYPGGCLVEGTNLSEGRGTTRPFELVGAPWLEPGPWLRALRRRALPGVLFREASFRPMFQKHAGRICHGCQVHVTDPGAFLPFETYLAMLIEARRRHPGAFDWRREAYEFETERLAIDLLLGRPELREAIENEADVDDLVESWQPGLREFVELRERFLLY